MEALAIHAEQDMALSQKSPSEGGDDGSPADECLDGGEQGWGCGSPRDVHLLMSMADGTHRRLVTSDTVTSDKGNIS